jgi:macrolide transport system ATP-binding/permease protein
MAAQVGLETRTGHRPTELSGGQCQRVAIARALINEPEVLFADEPTGALDSATGREILQLLDELHARGLSIILVTHDPNIAEHAHRTIRLSDGQIIADDRRESLPAAAGATPPPHRHSRLGFRDMLRIGLREGLFAHKLRTALTMLGVVIGVASVIAMSSFSAGSKKKQADQIRALGSNLIRITDRRLEGEALYSARAEGSPGLSQEDAQVLADTLPDIRVFSMARDMDLEVEIGQVLRPEAHIRAVKGAYLDVNNLTLQAGEFLTPDHGLERSRVAILGAGLVPANEKAEGWIGRTIRVGGQPFRVLGVLQGKYIDTTELEAVGANDSNLDLLIPLETALNRFTYLPIRSELDELQLQLAEEERLAPVGVEIRRILDVRHRGVQDYDLVIPLDLLKSKQESQKLLDLLSLCISAISLVVGGIGIMNIMLASVTERLREIGIRRAVGARAADIRNQFLMEATLISMAGGLIGVGLAMAGVAVASRPLAFPVVYTPGIMLVAFLAAFCTGLGFGAYPAIRASRQNLVDILSRE